jgi:hypothetical protein
MKIGDVVFVKYLNMLTEILDVNGGAVKVIVPFMEDITVEIWIQENNIQQIEKVGEI